MIPKLTPLFNNLFIKALKENIDPCSLQGFRSRLVTVMIWALGVHSSSHRPSGLQMWPYNNGLRGHKNTRTRANITLHTHTHNLMNECPTELTLILCFSIAGNFAETVPVSVRVCVCVCIIKPSGNIYWGHMDGRMLPVSSRGNEGSGEMMKRWCCCAEMRWHFTYNGNPESLSIFLSLSEAHWWPQKIKEEMQAVFRTVLGGVGESAWYFTDLMWN